MTIGTLLLFALVLIKAPGAEIFSSISGQVVDAKTGEAVSGVHVIARGYYSGGEATTDTKGIFSIRDLPPGDYTLTFVKTNSKYIRPETPQMNVVLPRGKNLVNVNYQMVTGGTITGKVRNVGEDILKKSSVGYELMNPKQSWGVKQGIAKIGSDGSFLIQGLPESDGVDIGVSIPGNVGIDKIVKVAPGQVVNVDFDVRWDDLTGIHGRVVTSDGNPQRDVLVHVRREGSEDIVAYAVTDEYGKYSIVGLNAGKYDVTVFINSRFIKQSVVVTSGSSAELNFVINGDTVKTSSLSKIIKWVCSFVVADAYERVKGDGVNLVNLR
ncbi:MAG TPA: carboxypeptidase-like regulatory domain-containing protein [Thermodesulfovibrionales bacterium]|nr:carboxypeptidase-like regulatory domain-containing protein [Thermodesulfovibrionales bacterium]